MYINVHLCSARSREALPPSPTSQPSWPRMATCISPPPQHCSSPFSLVKKTSSLLGLGWEGGRRRVVSIREVCLATRSWERQKRTFCLCSLEEALKRNLWQWLCQSCGKSRPQKKNGRPFLIVNGIWATEDISVYAKVWWIKLTSLFCNKCIKELYLRPKS